MPDDVLVAGPPDEVLLRSVTALRRLGARITRYDAEALTLEARLAGQPRGVLRRAPTPPALLRLRAAEAEPGHTRLSVEAETGFRLPWLTGRARLVRRFVRELARITTTPTTGRIDER